MISNRNVNKQAGMAMVLVITILAALLAIGAIGLSLQLNSTKSTKLIKESRASLYCAEAGLAAARSLLVSNASSWNTILTETPNAVPAFPAWYPISRSLDDDDGSGIIDDVGDSDDYEVTIADDGDDNDPLTDINRTIVVTSTCLNDSVPSTIIEVISLGAEGDAYRNQSGQGVGNTGNAN